MKKRDVGWPIDKWEGGQPASPLSHQPIHYTPCHTVPCTNHAISFCKHSTSHHTIHCITPCHTVPYQPSHIYAYHSSTSHHTIPCHTLPCDFMHTIDYSTFPCHTLTTMNAIHFHSILIWKHTRRRAQYPDQAIGNLNCIEWEVGQLDTPRPPSQPLSW